MKKVWAALLLGLAMIGVASAEDVEPTTDAIVREFNLEAVTTVEEANGYLNDYLSRYPNFGGTAIAESYIASYAINYDSIDEAIASAIAFGEASGENFIDSKIITITGAQSSDTYSLAWANSFGFAFAC